MIKYPAGIDSVIELPTIIDNSTPVSGGLINNLRDAVIAIETELGVKPSGIYTNVRSRIVALEIAVANISGGGGGGVFGGDLESVTGITQKVIGLQGRPLSAIAPTTNQTYVWDGSAWTPGTVSNFVAAGDLSGTESMQTVVGLQGSPVAPDLPTDGYLLTWVDLDNAWKPLPPPISFTAGGDLSGTESSQIVVGIQGRAVNAAAPLVGQAYLWSGSAWVPTAIARHATEIIFVAAVANSGDAEFMRVGARSLDLSQYPATLNGLTRTISFVADVQKTPSATSVEIQLVDITHGAIITGTDLLSTSNELVKVTSGTLMVGASPGLLRTDVETHYELQMKMNGGSDLDQAYCTNARLLVIYS